MPDAPLYSARSYRVHGIPGYGQTVNEDDDAFAQQESSMVVAETAATSRIFAGVSAAMDYSGVGGFSGSGHMIGTIGHARMNAASQTALLLIGAEGKITNLAGTITNATLLEANLGGNAASQTITNLIGCHVTVAGNAGTISNFTGVAVEAPGNTATITSTTAFLSAAITNIPTAASHSAFLAQNQGNGAAGSALAFQGQINTGSGLRRNLYCSGTAQNFLQGELRVGVDADMGALIGSDGAIAIKDGMTAPGTTAGYAKIYVDTADGDLKIKFGDGFVRLLGADS